MGQIRQNLFHLSHDIILSRKSHLVPYLCMNDISGPAEVRDHRDGASAEGFENYACAIVANRWKHEHISRSEVLEDFRMAERAAEENSLLNTKRPRQLLEAVPLWTIADHGKAGQIAAQNGSRRAQSKIKPFGELGRRRRSAQVWPQAPEYA